jgi:hypothetical protein
MRFQLREPPQRRPPRRTNEAETPTPPFDSRAAWPEMAMPVRGSKRSGHADCNRQAAPVELTSETVWWPTGEAAVQPRGRWGTAASPAPRTNAPTADAEHGRGVRASLPHVCGGVRAARPPTRALPPLRPGVPALRAILRGPAQLDQRLASAPSRGGTSTTRMSALAGPCRRSPRPARAAPSTSHVRRTASDWSLSTHNRRLGANRV